jgi:hypothetical protein
VAPVRSREGSLRAYYEELQTITVDHERREQEKGAEEDLDRRKRIQRKRMGFGE